MNFFFISLIGAVVATYTVGIAFTVSITKTVSITIQEFSSKISLHSMTTSRPRINECMNDEVFNSPWMRCGNMYSKHRQSTAVSRLREGKQCMSWAVGSIELSSITLKSLDSWYLYKKGVVIIPVYNVFVLDFVSFRFFLFCYSVFLFSSVLFLSRWVRQGQTDETRSQTRGLRPN